MDPYLAYAFPVRIVKDTPTYPVGGVVIIGEDGAYHTLRNLNTDESIQNAFRDSATLTGGEFPKGVTFTGAVDARGAFQGCTALECVKEGATFAKVERGENMFQGCSAMTSLPSTVDFGSLKQAEGMFKGCASLVSLPEGFAFPELEGAYEMFEGCKALRDIPASIIPPDGGRLKLSDGRRMFAGCSLNPQSVINILKALPESPGSQLGIGTPQYWEQDGEIAALLNTSVPIKWGVWYTTDTGWEVFTST